LRKPESPRTRGIIHHIGLTVRDAAVSAPFYEALLARDTDGIWRGMARRRNADVDIAVDEGGRIEATRR
jgi:hypothetical protein